MGLAYQIREFMSVPHTQDEIGAFYVTNVSPYDKRSINEILFYEEFCELLAEETPAIDKIINTIQRAAMCVDRNEIVFEEQIPCIHDADELMYSYVKSSDLIFVTWPAQKPFEKREQIDYHPTEFDRYSLLWVLKQIIIQM